uniref:CSON013928 protein n=1 Tax=Culicoides sonorensis TaxID=179676 RepID=A0A336KQ87_CULSO
MSCFRVIFEKFRKQNATSLPQNTTYHNHHHHNHQTETSKISHSNNLHKIKTSINTMKILYNDN